jgi:NAD(P)-dependent dehydrogenase (short-subunit alcohol dehydrogenase family)
MAGGFDLSGTTMLVTGAASGIGAATARCAAACGARVHLADLSEEVASRAEEIEQAATPRCCDVADPGEVEALVRAVGPVDALVHAAGICPFDDWLDPGFAEALDRVLAVNLKSALHLARVILPGMVERRRGRIVLVGSLAGKTGGLIAGPHYVAAKGGLHALVKWLAQQGGPHGILANGIAPASIETPMMDGRPVDTGRIPLRRKGLPEEVAWPIVFLCSPAASYVTGVVLDVNGGVSMG